MKHTLFILLAALFAVSCAQQSTQSVQADFSNNVVYELNTRQFTPEGTFLAAADQLQRLKETGVDIVWVMPLYPIGEKERKGTLGSYYAIRDYCATNPEFGTLEDFDCFVTRAHELGLKVIIDWVANHTSPDHAWVTEKPADWYVRDAQGNTIVEYDWTDIAKLNYDNTDMRAEMLRCMQFWINRGIDGLRCDMAYIVPQDFWTPALKQLRESADRPLYFLAEGEEPWLHEAGFDATYSWKLHHALNTAVSGQLRADSLAKYIEENAARFGAENMRLTFTSNHDENSWAGTEFERMGNSWKAMTVLCFTLPQSQPLLYTAQEMGYDHRFQFFEKDPVPAWKENRYTEFYRMLCQLRHDHPCLGAGKGSFELLQATDSNFRFRRSLDNDWVEVEVSLVAPWNWSVRTSSDRIAQLEPPCWWTGMETPLQLMAHGEGLGSFDVRIEGGKGVSVKTVHKAESPNYLFIDVDIAKDATPDTYSLVFSNGSESFSKPYEIGVKSTCERESFNNSDVMYLIMPDRYSNGDPSNDNSCCMTEKADYTAAYGRHGGDLQGIINHLDYLADLGITAIWLTPALEDNEPESSYHGYACTNYYRIDPRFGSNELYRIFVREAHKRGIKVVMDIVTNHSGDRYWWMNDLPFADWIHQWPAYTHSNCAFSAQNDPYCSELDRKNMQEGWFDTSMVDMNLDNPWLLSYFKQWGAWWVEWSGLDGFRIDTYPYNEKEPMADWNASIRKEYPWINIVGEVWTNSVPQVAYWQDDNPNPDGFDSNLPTIMDFCLQSAICGSINVDSENWEEGITKVYNSIANDVYLHNPMNIMVFPGNHDTDHLADVTKGNPDKMKLAVTLLSTVRGFPQFFSGDEIMAQSLALGQGDGPRRVEFDENWASDPVIAGFHDWMSQLLQWRKTSKAVHEGKTLHFLTRDNTYAYFRYTDTEAVFVFLNNNASKRLIPWKNYSEFTQKRPGQWTNALTGAPVNVEHLILPPKGSIILQLK